MSSRGFNRGRYNGKNSWRGSYRARKTSRGRGSFSNRPRTPVDNSDNEDGLNDSDVAELERKITASPAVFQLRKVVNSPYPGWRLYFPDNDYKTSPDLARKVEAAEEFIIAHEELFNEEEIEDCRSCVFDLKVCLSDNEFLEKWPTFNDDLFDEPATTLHCLGLGIHQYVLKSVREQTRVAGENSSAEIQVPLIKARVSNYRTSIPLKNLKTHLYGKLVSVSGTVIRVSNVKLQCSWLAFECAGCGMMQSVKQQDGIFTQPRSCLNRECHYRTFKPLRLSEYTQTYDCQNIRIQEQVPHDQREGGRVPRTVECEVSDDLASSCTPGDEITVIGIVKVCSTDKKKAKGPCMYSLYIEAVSLFNNKNMENVDGSNNDEGMAVQFTQKDFDAIQQIYMKPDLFKLLVQSLCPTIFGHEVVKAGLLLALFGGSEKDSAEYRAQSHVLVVGDPGLGKSQMLQSCAFVAPRGVFVCGNTTTSSGLTVTLTREGGGDFALEAGALVLADQGCCCIDEFDKMSNQHQSLLEVMEQQTVSIAKAGVICMLPARTTVLAAANPAGGHYNKAKTVAENLRMGQALLSRFDLVFILLDQPNEQFDTLLSEHVMKIHSGKGAPKKESAVDLDKSMHSLNTEDIKLSERLRMKPRNNIDLLTPTLLRKYIAYARKYVPEVRLSEEAQKALHEFYLYLRQNHHTKDTTPVTTRQLLSLIRLTQARAKVELREEANLQDATDVIDLMRWSLVDTFTDELGTLDFQRSQHGSGISSKNQTKRFLAALHQKCEALSKSTFSVSEMKEIAKLVKVDVTNFSSLISTLNVQGFLLKKGRESYQVLSAD